ncbi:hypothetical protein [Microbulbifer yueqingensis]|uniref:Lipoprotein n=1 Tax=Microbulbifer yueqingensis TaxID=658219 RepID=A0A1G9BMC7_9GAMM|nr:hypothetical protein [Microbulbifer yueqingensis]SDK40390.1 hypothetical protein SAMN05216212_2291 [Microbulbifer yueqingensis]
MISTARLTALAAVLYALSGPAAAQAKFLGFQEDAPNPRVKVAPAEILLDIPMPVSGADLADLLARANSGLSLSAIKEEALRVYQQHLHRELSEELAERFADAEIPVVEGGAQLTLSNFLEVKAIKHFSELRKGSDQKLERGTVELEGVYRYQWRTADGTAMREGEVNLADLRIRESYKVKSDLGGNTQEDTTEEAIKRALSEMVEEMLDKSEDDFEPEQLRSLASL